MRWLLTCALLLIASPALAVPIIADISSHKIEIHSGFTGTQLLLFGARNEPGDIVITIRGPAHDFIVRKKERVAGIWVNSEQRAFQSIPHFYGIASNKPLDDVRQYKLFDVLGITAPEDTLSLDDTFQSALYHNLLREGLYSATLGDVDFMGETLFKAEFNFPDNLPRGSYLAEAYLFSDGVLSGVQSIPIQVFKTGFDAFLFDAAHRYSVWYGLIAVGLALSIGWFASWLFSRF